MNHGTMAPVSRLVDRCQRIPVLHADFLEHHAVLPIERIGDAFKVASWRESVEPRVLDDLRLVLGSDPKLEFAPEDEVRDAIRRVYAPESVSAEDMVAELPEVALVNADNAVLDDLVHLANEAPVVKLVNLLLLEALDSRASDVHLECRADGLRTRYRIDGVLQDAVVPPAQLRAAVINRFKIMADLDFSERRLPEVGRIRLRLRNRDVDVRVSTAPTLHGESIVLRLLDRDRGSVELDEIGMQGEVLSSFRRVIAHPHGIVLATGPTGSGKTTTLYAAVGAIRTGQEKILTVEDPVEYELQGVPQLQVNEKAGLTFASALRSLLRQDPDVILVGEIRDGETAEIATQAALTGHLVLSTLHTNDSASALTRLMDLGVPSYLVGTTVQAVLAQRLVRVICRHCSEPTVIDQKIRDHLGAVANDLTSAHRGAGCADCRNTGFRGRTGVYELLLTTEPIRAAMTQGVPAAELRAIASQSGMSTLRDDALRLVRAGVTTADEVLRITA
ncbi:MAG: GspE/PulE family protein [Gemmatimonadota bacterium]